MLERNVQDPLETHPASYPKDQSISEKYNQILNKILLDMITFADQEFWKRHNQVQI